MSKFEAKRAKELWGKIREKKVEILRLIEVIVSPFTLYTCMYTHNKTDFIYVTCKGGPNKRER